MIPAKRLCVLVLALALPACHRRLPRPGKPTAAPVVQLAASPAAKRPRPRP